MPRINRSAVAEAFGKALRAVRRERGLSQERLADLGSFDRTYPSLLERGLRQPTLTVLMDLADALGVSAERLVSDTQARLPGCGPAPPDAACRLLAPTPVGAQAQPATELFNPPPTGAPSGGHRA